MDIKYFLVLCYTLGLGGTATSSDENFPSGNEIDYNVSEAMPTEDVYFTLLKKNDLQIPISIHNSSEYLKKVFNLGDQTKLIVHGWLGSNKAYIVKHTGEVYVKYQGGNIVAVDWSILSSWKIYPLSALNVATAGQVIAAMVDKLVESKATTLDKIHLIGHSLGAHVMGIAGSLVKSGKVSRITGLDPAKPGFENIVYESQRLDPSDAEFVDVIHSAAGAAGYYSPLGHVDFYPNGGTPPQPGCFEPISDPMKLVGCSHGRSYEYFGESISNPKGFKSYECDSWNSYKSGACNNNTITYMGDPTPPIARGIFYLETNAKTPFAKG